MRDSLGPALFDLFLLSCSNDPHPGPSATMQVWQSEHHYFMLDAVTRAQYLHFLPSGRYKILDVEHMGIFQMDSGRWEAQGDTLVLHSEGPRLKKRLMTRMYSPITHRGMTVLMSVSPDYAGKVDTPENIKAAIDAENGKPPFLHFVEISRETFERGSTSTYPFKFYPELNRQTQ